MTLVIDMVYERCVVEEVAQCDEVALTPHR